MPYLFCRAAKDPVSIQFLRGIPLAADRYKYLKCGFTEPIYRVLKSLDYKKEFLWTLYWRIVRDYLISRGPSCACGSKHLLDLHHINYDHHGREHLFLDDLVFQCMECHKKGHNISKIKIERVFRDLALKKRGPQLPSKGITNPNYDPRTKMNLMEYGDIRGYVDAKE